MAVYKTKLLDRKEVASGTMAFYFEKPVGFSFKPGQHMDWTLLNPPKTDAEGNTRTFSLANGPSEERLMMATRMRDTAFKNVLKDAPFGTEVEMNGPFGGMILHNDVSKPAVMFAGGIGITPFRSMLVDAAERKLPHKIYLFYSNRTPEDSPFLPEIIDIEAKNPNYILIATMTKFPQWTGEQGYITAKMVTKYVPDIHNAVCYYAGPPSFGEAIRKLLEEMQFNFDYLKSEDFTGY